ncbi:hypothetical protein BJY04DRAFT_182435 [Aspergillus karnatakaensis]|uniref:putative Chromo domain protein Chp1p n=1 Tax=Aspergillus karnatakaensis TaxID=1810916 RepID=UPI003CCDE370
MATGDISDDEISLTSTVESEQKSEYEVETILAEDEFPDGRRYLVRWAGYSDDRSTWEPADMFAANETFIDWETKKQQIAEGKEPAFDVAAWEARLRRLGEERDQRKSKRAAKRRRINSVQLSARRSARAVPEAAKQRPNKPKSPTAPSSTNSLPSGRAQPARKALSGPSRKSPVGFGSSETAPDRSRHKKPITDTGKLFQYTSTQYRFAKALKREPEPNINQLDLRRPSDWDPIPISSASAAQLGNSRHLPAPVNNSPVGYAPGSSSLSPSSLSQPDSNTENFPRSENDEATSLTRRDTTSKGVPSMSPREFSLEVPRRIPERGAYPVYSHPHSSRWYYKPDVYVTMYFGIDKLKIGNVRLCDLEPETRLRVLRTKVGKEIVVWFRDFCTLEEYNELCNRRGRNHKYSNGWVEGFDDTEPAIRQAAVTLWQNSLVAIARVDSSNDLLAYPPGSHFAFLDEGARKPQPAYLNLTCRFSLGSLDFLRSRAKDNLRHLSEMNNSTKIAQPDSVMVNTGNFKQYRSLDITQENMQSPTASPTLDSPITAVCTSSPSRNRATHQFSIGKSAMQRLSYLSAEGMNNDDQIAQARSPARTDLKADPAIDLDELFRDNFNITFEGLCNINSNEKGKASRVKTAYVWFPEDLAVVRGEKELLLELVKKHTSLSFSNSQDGDWEKFSALALTADMHAALLFHESFADYHKIPALREILRRSNASCWNVSLSRPLEPVGRGVYFQRLFPHGGVILLTEDFMIRDTEATMITLEWFLDWTKRKFPGSWKIMLRPDVLNWVKRQTERCDTKVSKYVFFQRPGISMIFALTLHNRWFIIYQLLKQLGLKPYDDLLPGIEDDDPFDSLVISPPKLPDYGSRTPEDSPDIPRDCTQEQRDADHLAEFFAGWCLVNTHRFRKFTMVTALRPLDRWMKWQHVEIQPSAKDFFNNPAFKVDYKTIWDRVNSRPKSSQAPDPGSYTPKTPRTPKPASAPASEQRSSSSSSTAQASFKQTYAQPYQ